MRKQTLVSHLALTTGRPVDVLNRYKVTELEKMVGNPYQLTYEQARELLVSIRNTGGASYRPFDSELNPQFGYMVAIPGFERQVQRVWNSEDLRLVINQWLSDISYTGDSRAYIGVWEHDNKLYLDLAQRFIDLEIAIVTGKQRNQIAIHDCKNKRDIQTS